MIDSLLLRVEREIPGGIERFAGEVERAGGEAPRVRLLYLRALPLVDAAIPNAGPELSKSASASDERRARGNARYAAGDNRGALDLYAAAVAIAPPDSDRLKLAYGNRSAALFALGRFDSCAQDVGRALAFDCDDRLREKLERRRAAAAAANGRREPDARKSAEGVPFGPPPRTLEGVPCASDAVRVAHSPDWGRHVLAARDVAVGETLAFEEPFASILLAPQRRRRCYECCAPRDAPIPCEGCDRAMFCDERCRKRSFERGHRYECPLMATLEELDFTKIELLGLRIALRARADAASWEELREEARSHETPTDPLATGTALKDGKPIYDSEFYASVHALETNASKRTGFNLANKCFSAAVMLRLLEKRSTIFDDVEDERREDPDSNFWFLGGLILHHIMTVASNGHGVEELEEDLEGNFLQTEQICSCLYPFLSLVNHSCAPNVTRVTIGTKTALLALRPLSKGQQVFDNYGQHHAMQNIHQRRKALQFQYLFECRCEACVDRWPLYYGLSPAKLDARTMKEFKNIIDAFLIEKLQKGDKTVALSVLTQLYKNVTILEPYAPCKELADHQETIKQCWALFGNVRYIND